MNYTYSIEIALNPEKVFAWIEDQEKAKRWQKAVKSGEIILETPGKIGTTFREVLEENGKKLEMYGEIRNYIPDRLLSFHLKSKIHIVDVTFSVKGDENRSTATVESKIKWLFPMNVITLFMGKKIKNDILSQTEAEFCELKRLCER